MALPSVYDHLDYRAFLREWFDAKKAKNPRYSHRAFAQRAGQKSPSVLVDVINGRRNLTPVTTEGFCRALGLTAAECRFFTALVQFGQAAAPAEKNEAWDVISAARRFRAARRIEGEGFRYLSHWYFPAIREMAALADFRPDPRWIAQRLQPPVTAREAADALASLQELGLVAPGEDGRLKPTEKTVTTAHQVVGLAAHNYHGGMLRLAGEAITRFKSKDRHFSAVTAAIPRSLVPRIKAELDQMQERLIALFDSAEDPSDQVIQVHLHFFPLTDIDDRGSQNEPPDQEPR